MNILEYTDKYLKLPLYPAQRFILKLYYGLPLEDSLTVTTLYSPKEYKVTERQYLQLLQSEERTNAQEGISYIGLLLKLGMRSGTTSLASIVQAYELAKLVETPEDRPCSLVSLSSSSNEAECQATSFSDVIKNDTYLMGFLRYTENKNLHFSHRGAPRGEDPSINVLFGKDAHVFRGQYCRFQTILDIDKRIDDAVKEARYIQTCYPQGPCKFLISSLFGNSDLFNLWVEESFQSNSTNLFINLPTWEVNPKVKEDILKLYLKGNSETYKLTRDFGNPLTFIKGQLDKLND